MKTVKCVLLLIMGIALINCNDSLDNLEPEIAVRHDPIMDIDGNIYNTMKIKDQIWITENLNVGHFKNGDPIPEAKTNSEWAKASTEGKPAWCWLNDDPNNGQKYGKLYNWYALTDLRGLAPEDWHIPSTAEWVKLTDYYLSGNDAGKSLKSISGWNAGGNGNNSSLFNALPGGYRLNDGTCNSPGIYGLWWSSSTGSLATTAWARQLSYSNNSMLPCTFDKGTGMSVRVVKIVSTSDSQLTLTEKLQKALDDGLNPTKGKGISAAVIFANGWKWAGASGVSHGSTKVTPDMRFSCGSIEKIFAATAILKLAEEGKISLDDSLYQWIGPYPYVDSTITIRQLLNHTSGLYNFIDNQDFWHSVFTEPTKTWDPGEAVVTFNHASLFPKGTGWNYSQTGYNIIKMIIMKITGKQISVVNNEQFFIPLGLSNSFTLIVEALPEKIAHGWYDMNNDGVYDDLFLKWPRTAFSSAIGGEVWSNAEDLAKWAKALFRDKIVLKQESIDQMLTFHSPCTGEEFFTSGYGLGVMRVNPEIVNGLVAYGHGGNAPGYGAATLYFPEYHFSMGLLDNTESGESIGETIKNLLDVLKEHFKGN
jgi:uncharacterized protein (TIGR02145 family)